MHNLPRPSIVATLLLFISFASTSIFGQNPTVRFQKFSTLGPLKEKTASISVGDIDGDRDLDLVVANGRHWPGQNRIYFNDGSGGFKVEKPLFDQTDKTYATPLADLDGDGDLDVVVGNDRQPSYVLLNDGKGKFKKSQTIGGLVPTRSITLADIDKRNGIDILITNRGAPNQIFFNNGKGRFDQQKQFGNKSDSTIDVAVADLNGDGHNDLALANRDGQQNYVYFGDGKGNFEVSVKYGRGNDETRGVEIVDFDQDGHLDILNANIGQANAIYFGDGSGKFDRSVEFGGNARSYHLACVPLHQKDKSKLIIVVANTGSQNAAYVQNPDQSFQQTLFGIKPTRQGQVRSAATYGVATGDFDGDGFIEVATANSDDENTLYRYIGKKLP